MGLGRVIARPFIGLPGSFQRTPNRHDYAMPPIAETLLDRLVARVTTSPRSGKISDLFAGRGISSSHPTKSDADGVDKIEALMATQERGLIFANLVDFDAVYGHRNDTPVTRRTSSVLMRGSAALLPQTPSGRPARDHRRSRQRSDHAEHGSFAGARAVAADGHTASRPASISAPARPLRISGRRSPKFRRWAAGERHELPARHHAAQIMDRRMTRLDSRAARATGAGDPGAASVEERRQQGPGPPRKRRSDSAGVPARSRSHHPHQGVPPSQAQDAGVFCADWRPLPHAADAYA